MKSLVALVALATVVGIVLFPLVGQRPHAPKRLSPEAARREWVARARARATLEAFRRGEPTWEAEARSTMRALPASDVRRLSFAKALFERGETVAAYDVARPRVRFVSAGGRPDPSELEFYAQIAKRAGHPDEAVWARRPEEARFRGWAWGQRRAFAPGHVACPKTSGDYRHAVNSTMDVGLKLFPGHRAAVEALRREFLAIETPKA